MDEGKDEEFDKRMMDKRMKTEYEDRRPHIHDDTTIDPDPHGL